MVSEVYEAAIFCPANTGNDAASPTGKKKRAFGPFGPSKGQARQRRLAEAGGVFP